MASISKLSVRGVRAFSPEDAEQVVEFYFPLTMIVGANGCGKTTIIEALKYAVAGGLPPGAGAKAGQAFVHDPKSLGQSQVKANVKLRFTSRSGQQMVVVRSMEVTQKKTTSSFKQLDGVLRTQDPKTGERMSLSHKCTELDKQIPQLLGTTKAILDSVLFCHQEDACWPMAENAVLKKKFDAIFDSTRYTKALTVFQKTEKEMKMKVKDLNADLQGLASHQHAAKNFRKDLADQMDQVEMLDDQKKEIKEAITKAEGEMKTISAIIDEMEDMDNEIDGRNTELDREKSVLKEKQRMLDEDLTAKHSIKELNDMLRDFDRKMSGQVEKKEELKDNAQRLTREIEGLRQEEMGLTSSKGKFAAELEAHESRLKERYTKMEHIAQTYAIDLQVTQSQQDPNRSISSQTSITIGGGTTGPPGSQDSVISIAPEDMQHFFTALEQKELDLKDNLKQHRRQRDKNLDQIQGTLTELGGKKNTLENERNKLISQRKQALAEQAQLAKQALGGRHRKSDIEEARKQATRIAKQRDEASNDPRKTEIPIEIRQMEEKIDKIKRELDDDRMTLDALRHSTEAQNSIVVLQEQCAADLEGLEDAFSDQNYTLQKFNIEPPPKKLPSEGDDTGGLLVSVVDDVCESVRSKYSAINSDISKNTEEVGKAQQVVSEQSALLASKRHRQATVKTNLDVLSGDSGSRAKVCNVVAELRRHENKIGASLTVDENSPQELVNYLDDRLEEIEEDLADLDAPKVAKKVLQKLKKMAMKPVGEELQCPCCTRGMNPGEVQTFVQNMESLMNDSVLVRIDEAMAERHRAAKTNYTRWKRIVSDCVGDLRDYGRYIQETADLEKEAKQLQDALSKSQSVLQDEKEKCQELQTEADELQALVDATKRWSDDAGRIAEKRMQINQKFLDLSITQTDTGRDLKTVEKEMNDRMEKKDQLTDKISKLNKESTRLNDKISNFSQAASRMDQRARELETKFAEAEKAAKKRSELAEQLEKIAEDEKKLQEQIPPLSQKIRVKESEKQKMRALASEEEQSLIDNTNKFNGDFKHLRDLTAKINSYLQSNKPQQLDRITAKVDKLSDEMNAKKQSLQDLQPELQRISKAVDDQQTHKKLLQQNIEVIEGRKRIKELQQEIERLEEDRMNIKGHDTASAKYSAAQQIKEKNLAAYARIEGRWGEIVEQIRSLKRKLAMPEYKSVDEQHRVAMIKHETTQIAAEDLKKYYTALEKALLQYHRVKITEINKIIRELWLLTYKGEDISCIELESGQESASKSSKSYNYRVVMTKGNTKIDMRARCSAGQRVLASIVIRLALAETFGVNCGCIALDEPTVNLDEKNKKGLAVALAQIVASRSQQRNFQLILITHDEDFVGIMKTELSSLTGFSMPEKYFKIYREMGPDGKYYSKINPIDWDEML